MKLTEKLTQVLSGGSGFDYDTTVRTNKAGTKVYVSAAYHCMDENGFYDGVIPFTVSIPIANPRNFRLTFNYLNGAGWYRVRKYWLREYIDQVVADAIWEAE